MEALTEWPEQQQQRSRPTTGPLSRQAAIAWIGAVPGSGAAVHHRASPFCGLWIVSVDSFLQCVHPETAA